MSFSTTSNHGRRLLSQTLQQRTRWGGQLGRWQQPGGYNNHRTSVGSVTTADLHTFALQRNDRDENQVRLYHNTPPSKRVVAAIMGLGTLSALAYAASSAAKSYEEWKAAQPTPEELEEMRKADEAEREKTKSENSQTHKAEDQAGKEEEGPRENFFKKFFDVGTNYYEGGFEETMTRREAALILGVRESASPRRVRDAHRKLLILNHPDTGGSTYLSGKINEAKELLLKGRAKA